MFLRVSSFIFRRHLGGKSLLITIVVRHVRGSEEGYLYIKCVYLLSYLVIIHVEKKNGLF